MGATGLIALNELATRNAPDVRLPVRHLVVAAGALLLAALLLVPYGPSVLRDPVSTRGLALTHIVTLGWITLTIMGASYQMVPVVLGVRLWSERIALVAFWHYVPGVLLLVAGFWLFWPPLIAAGGALVVGGLVGYAYNMTRTLAGVRAWGLHGPFFAVATGFLVAVGLYGLTLATDILHPFLGQGPVDHIVFHILLGAGGWITLLAMGVAYKLTPMFALSHGRGDGWGRAVLALVAGGLLLLIAVLALDPSPAIVAAAAAVPLLGVLLFIVDQALYLRMRNRRRLDLGLRFTVAALAYLGATGLLAWMDVAGRIRVPASALVVLALLGWAGSLISGQLYKIVPFLVWYDRYGDRVGLEPVPLLRDMYDARRGEANLWTYAPAPALLAIGAAASQPLIAEVGAIALLAGAVLLLSNLVQVLWPGRGRRSQPASEARPVAAALR
jgi:hypothetical protein